MVQYNTVKPSAYYDSVTLMLISSRLTECKGVREAAVMMGTDHNKALMTGAGLLTAEAAGTVTPNDLVIGISAEDEDSLKAALDVLEEQFHKKATAVKAQKPKTMESALAKDSYNFAVISIPGKYAKNEAMKALRGGLHVLLFSDNVSLPEEVELKTAAKEKGLLMMGPDCGTAIINGVALGFANVVRRGNIGLVAAAGTGLQEVTVQIDRMGGGISQALGTGGRDLKDEVGGTMMLMALEALSKDDSTRVIGLISKPPSPNVMKAVLNKAADAGKPVVACFLGGDPEVVKKAGIIPAATLEEAAAKLTELSGAGTGRRESGEGEKALIEEQRTQFTGTQKYVRGLYSGGTMCYESMLLMRESIGDIYSNIATDKRYSLGDPEQSVGNALLDMGEDYFTDGMPHPMIDMRLRSERIKKEARDPEVAVILLDCVLGYGCHEDPAGALAQAVRSAKELAGNRTITFIASVCGTDRDAQNKTQQEQKLREAGVIVTQSNEQAARLAAGIVSGLGGK